MSAEPTGVLRWPNSPAVMQNALMDSERWKSITIREGDAIIASYGKSGTTWVQQIIGQILSKGDPSVEVAKASPWIEMRMVSVETYAALEASGQRRFFKTHSMPQAIPYSPLAKYVYVGRDGRDVCWSLHNHFSSFTDEFLAAVNALPNRNGPPLERGPADVHDFYVNWIRRQGAPAWPFWDNVRSWWQSRTLPNVRLVHFNELKSNLEKSVVELAVFLDSPIDKSDLRRILDHCSFDYMKEHAASNAPRGGAAFVGGAKTFMNKGTNGRWRDTLTAEETAAYDEKAENELGCACAQWLANGGAVV
jgi:aryl sulfotransferase